jgi:hypothetical protein
MVRDKLAAVLEAHPDAVLVHGDAKRGDRQAAGIWKSLGGTDDPMPADWDECDPVNDVACQRRHRKRRKDGTEYCPTAGHRRNTAMVETAPALCLSFIRARSHGATDCTEKAEGAGIPTVRYTHKETNDE